MAKGDSTVSHHYWRTQDTKCAHNMQDCAGPAVLLPNNQTISSTKNKDNSISQNNYYQKRKQIWSYQAYKAHPLYIYWTIVQRQLSSGIE